MRVASWNIAGGHTVKSQHHYDYLPANLDYFASQLQPLQADIICLQEVQTGDGYSDAAEIADKLDGYQVYEAVLSPSHIDPAFHLGTAILTKHPYSEARLFDYPLPSFDLHFPSGRAAQKHRKAVQLVNYNGLCIANTHLLPAAALGFDYLEGKGEQLALDINTVLLKALRRPLLFCGDMGMSNEYTVVLEPVVRQFSLRNALPPDRPTYHKASERGGLNAPDCIYYSTGDLQQTDGGITVTLTDHYLCWADIE